MASWYTPEEARVDWRDAPSDDDYLQQLLDVAQIQVLEWAPARVQKLIVGTDDVPINLRQAHLMQTRNLWNAAKTDPSSTIGADGGFTFTPFPLDWTVKAVIRPKRAKPNPR